jgi:hypothetical protein
MIDMSVTWIDPPIGTTSHEKPPFRCIKNNSRPKTAILSSDLPSSMCGLKAAPACPFAFAIFPSKIEADVRSDHRMALPARFTVLL